MPFSKAGLAAVVALTIASLGGAAYAQSTDPATQALATQIQNDLVALAMNNGGTPTDEQIQQTIASDLALSNITLAQKEAALQLVETAALAAGSTLPPGTAGDIGIAYAALTTTGSFVAAAGGGAGGGAGFGSTGTGGSLGGGSGGPAYKTGAG